MPYIPEEDIENKTLYEIPRYKNAFENFLKKLLNESENYDSVSSLQNYIDEFNYVINGGSLFNKQKIIKDIKDNFNRIYLDNEYKKKIELKGKKLKSLENINENYEEFIKKQNLNFEFEIKNEEFQFYGSSPDYDKYYEELRKNKTFKIDKDIFLDLYKDQKLELELKRKKAEIQIDNLFAEKKEELENYFSKLNSKNQLTRKWI